MILHLVLEDVEGAGSQRIREEMHSNHELDDDELDESEKASHRMAVVRPNYFAFEWRDLQYSVRGGLNPWSIRTSVACRFSKRLADIC